MMYYNSNHDNEEYYNAYKKEMQELEKYEKEEKIQKIIKLTFIVLTTILSFLSIFFLYQYFYPTPKSSENGVLQNQIKKVEKHPKIIIRESDLPQSIQLAQTDTKTQKKSSIGQTNLTAEDIALIVKIIISQLEIKKEIPLEEQLAKAEQQQFEHHSLKESNHYNKVILTTQRETQVKNSALVELSSNINSLLEEQQEVTKTTSYTESIKKELKTRRDEMRVIVVKKGDTLSKIAKRAYGDYKAYLKIFDANPEIIKNPNEIFVGQRLRIPS